MRASELTTADDLHERDMADGDYRAEHERTRFANEVAIRVICYRVEHAMTQTSFGKLVGMRQPHVARLEFGDHEPSLDTLARLSAALDVDFTVSITPSCAPAPDPPRSVESNGDPFPPPGIRSTSRWSGDCRVVPPWWCRRRGGQGVASQWDSRHPPSHSELDRRFHFWSPIAPVRGLVVRLVNGRFGGCLRRRHERHGGSRWRGAAGLRRGPRVQCRARRVDGPGVGARTPRGGCRG